MTKQEAIEHFGGAAQLAAVLGINRQAVYQWDEVPELQQLRLEKITNGALKADSDSPSSGEQPEPIAANS